MNEKNNPNPIVRMMYPVKSHSAVNRYAKRNEIGYDSERAFFSTSTLPSLLTSISFSSSGSLTRLSVLDCQPTIE